MAGFYRTLVGPAIIGVSVWCAAGTVAVLTNTNSTASSIDRLVALAPWWIGLIAAGLAALVPAWRTRPSTALPALLSTLPWWPVPLPAMALVWTGPLAWVPIGAAWLVAVGSGPLAWLGRASGAHEPVRAARLAAMASLTIGIGAAWAADPQVPGGDEPHYLVITQSLLKDGDLEIGNNHRQRDYASFAPGNLPPHVQILRRDGRIYSIHAPGLPAVVAPAFAIGGYAGAVLLLLAIAALGSALTWHLAWLVTRRADAAWFGWAAVTLSVTWIFHSFTIYPDGPGAVLMLSGAWALLRTDEERRNQASSVRPWLWHGAALAALPWMHSRFSVLAGGVAALVLLRLAHVPNPASKALAFLSVPIVSALGWFGYFIALYGTPDPAAAYAPEPASFAFVPDGLAGLLFDQRFGLVAYAPVLIFALIGIG